MTKKNEKKPMIAISLAYAPSVETHLYQEIEVEEGTSILQALISVGWLEQFPELKTWCEANQVTTKIDKKSWRVGVFSEKKLLTYALKAHDRVEVYRPLALNPMRKRKERATQQ